MDFIILFGPPAVGKMTVGDEITRLTGMPVFHNHLSIEPVLRFFPFGSPAFSRVVGGFRTALLQEVAQSDLPGVVFTFVWGLEEVGDAEFLRSLGRIFEAVGARIFLVELQCDLPERLLRNKAPERLAEKPSKRDTAKSEVLLLDLDKRYRMNSDGPLPLDYPHLKIDNTALSAAEVAQRIVSELSLPLR